jgi:hypothetical protein
MYYGAKCRDTPRLGQAHWRWVWRGAFALIPVALTWDAGSEAPPARDPLRKEWRACNPASPETAWEIVWEWADRLDGLVQGE